MRKLVGFLQAVNYQRRYLAQRKKQTARTTITTTTTTTSTTTPAPFTPPPITYTGWKWQNLGNRQGLEKFRRQTLLAKTNRNQTFGQTALSLPSNSNHHHHPRRNRGGDISSNENNTREPTSTAMISAAIDHAMRVKEEGECKVPLPRLVQIQDLYPHPSKEYVPHCTILHHCSDDTGCCRYPETCVPKTQQKVELPFLVSATILFLIFVLNL